MKAQLGCTGEASAKIGIDPPDSKKGPALSQAPFYLKWD